MKLLFIKARAKVKEESLFSFPFKKLPRKIGLVALIQFTDYLLKIKEFLEKNKKQVFIEKAKGLALGQVLGCNVKAAVKIKDKVDAFLFIGSGMFHPLAIAKETGKKVFCYDPLTKNFFEVSEKEVEKIKRREKGLILKFLSSASVGLLVSVKPGQERIKEALKLKEKLTKQGKRVYIFLFDEFRKEQLENFPQIQCWINLACPGLSLEENLLWFEKVKGKNF